MIIEYYTKNEYGRKRHYPVDNKVRTWIILMTKRSTFNDTDLEIWKQLGVKLKQVVEPKRK